LKANWQGDKMDVKKFFKYAGVILMIIIAIGVIIVAAYYFLSGAIKILFALSIFSVFILNGKRR
jgi:hypothetical protein